MSVALGSRKNLLDSSRCSYDIRVGDGIIDLEKFDSNFELYMHEECNDYIIVT